MGHNRHALTDVAVKAAIKSAKAAEKGRTLSDGHGLSLLITKDGAAYWQHSYRFGGKQIHLRLGVYPALTIVDARKLHGEQRELLKGKVDPGAAKKEAKAEAKRELADAKTFRQAADAWFKDHKKGLSAKYASVIEKRLAKWLVPTLGPMRLEEIKSPHVVKAIKPIEEQGSIDLARRMKIIAGQIFACAMANGWIERNPSEGIEKALAPRPAVKHRAKLKAADLPEFFKRLEAYEGYPITKLAIRFIMQTAVRTDELRFAEWHEIEGLDSDRPMWRIPPERMKMDKPHMVPLSSQAVTILKEARRLYPKSKLIFPSEESRTGAMSENAMLYALYYMGYKGKATVHGFRGTFSTVLNENDFAADWIEVQLAHTEDDKVRAAYNAAKYLPKRREMLQWWSDYLDRASRSELAVA